MANLTWESWTASKKAIHFRENWGLGCCFVVVLLPLFFLGPSPVVLRGACRVLWDPGSSPCMACILPELYIWNKIQVILMVLGKFFNSVLFPNFPHLPSGLGSSCVFVSGCACAILGLSFLTGCQQSRCFSWNTKAARIHAASSFVLNTCVWAV